MSIRICFIYPRILEYLVVANTSEHLFPPNHGMLRPKHITRNTVYYSFPSNSAFFYVAQNVNSKRAARRGLRFIVLVKEDKGVQSFAG